MMGSPGGLHRRIIILFSILSLATYALPVPSTKSAAPRATSLTLSAPKCATTADNDLYGTGVRIGLYLQWASGFILRNLESWETRSRVRAISNTLCAAIALATVVKVLKGSAMSVDYLLSYYLTVVLFYTESYNLEIRVDDMHARNPASGRSSVKTLELHADAPLVCQNVIFTAFTLFGAWYWLKGVYWTSDPVCGAQAALLGTFDIRHGTWRHAAAGLAVVAGVAFFMVFLIHLTSLYDGIKSGPKLVAIYYARAMYSGCGGDRSNNDWKYTLKLKRLLKPDLLDVEVSGPAALVKVFGHLVHYFLIFLAGPLIAIVSVERMIAANYLVTTSALGSAGQVIALFSGITSALLACWEVAAKRTKAGGGRQQADTAEESSQDSPAATKQEAPSPAGQSKKPDPITKEKPRKPPPPKRKPRIWFSEKYPNSSQGRLMRWFRIILLPFRPHKELRRAVKWGDKKAVRRMLRLRINPDKLVGTDRWASTAMHEAADNGNLEIISTFLDHGASVDVRDGYQETPLSRAVMREKIDMVNFLIQKGADVHARDRRGWTPIYRAAFCGSEAIIDVLLANGADINVKNDEGNVPLEAACGNFRQKTIRYLLERGADPRLVDMKRHRRSREYRECLDIIERWKPKVAAGDGLSGGVGIAC